MKIRKLGFTSIKISCNDIDLVTDPLFAEEAGVSINKTIAEVVLLTGDDHLGQSDILEDAGFSKIEPKKRERVIEIASPGEYEVGGVLIRRPVRTDYYIIDEDSVRLVYFGRLSPKFTVDSIKDMGDVDILVVPVGEGGVFPSFEKLEKLINKIDPTYLIPVGYNEDGVDTKLGELQSVEHFLKQFGSTNVKRDNKFALSVGTEPENKVVEVIVLEQ